MQRAMGNIIVTSKSKQWDTTTYPLEWLESATLTNGNDGEDIEQQSFSYIAGGNAKWYSHFGKQFSSFL